MDLLSLAFYFGSSIVGGLTVWSTTKFFDWLGHRLVRHSKKIIGEDIIKKI